MSNFANQEMALVAVMGLTGSGKTEFVNLVSGSNLPVGDDLEACTKKVALANPCQISGKRVLLIDTPGFDDTEKEQVDVLREIAAFLKESYEGGRKLTGVIYMQRISDNRVSGIARKSFRLFSKICGDDAMKNVVIVTNMWEEVPLQRGQRREHELATKSIFFKDALDHGAQMQHDMVDDHKEPGDTAAGKELRSELEETVQRQRKEIEELQEEIQYLKGKSAKDAELHRQEINALRDTCASLNAQVARVEEQNKKLQSKIDKLESGKILDRILRWAHVSLAPYTKVEESFNLHAVHDLLMYGLDPNALENYDHFIFPGAVPRTFVGSIALASLSYPIIQVASLLEFVSDKADLQVIVRLVLATLNAIGFCLLRRAVSRRFGRPTSVFFVLLTCTQFHLPFWMGRTLPNMFALFPVNLAMYFLLNRGSNSNRPSKSSVHSAIALLTFTAVVFRWPLWPEFYGLYFNVILGKSSDWGVSPFYIYFTSFLPKLLLSSLPLSLIGALLDPRVRALLVQRSHSWRSSVVWDTKNGASWFTLFHCSTLLPPADEPKKRHAVWSTLYSGCCRFAYVQLHRDIPPCTRVDCEYPGGAALSAFNHIYAGQDTGALPALVLIILGRLIYPKVHVHISNLAAQTGASLFLHTHAPPYLPGLPMPQARNWTYDKTEHLSPKALTADPMITHVIAESASAFPARQWAVVGAVDGFDGWRLNRDVASGFKMGLMEGLKGVGRVLEMVRSEKLFILERKG
ncbi:putative Dol-P-Man:Man(7)GlcNAc(2)-PP-Dol alpha-1,6-mannosyltransferase [Grifola frondosa]|uniref:Mannosyltransferase n=1 Tax=Grifola frondosa TaxID=5627 RepID=A0A1C7LQW0_GRIFR|nr:putative Dol-P-Man:Man(7)GlcNAc(2)-PP-Dol alpha-1,6-mannosyltransferase [Grifola frondosa]